MSEEVTEVSEDTAVAVDAARSAGRSSEDVTAGTSLPNRLMSLTQVLPNRPETQLGPACSPSGGMRTALGPVRGLFAPRHRCRADRHGTCSTAARVWVPAFPLRWNRRREIIARVRGPRTGHRRPCTRCLNASETNGTEPLRQQHARGQVDHLHPTVAPSRATSSCKQVKPVVSTTAGSCSRPGNASTVGPAPETVAGTPAARKASTNRPVAG